MESINKKASICALYAPVAVMILLVGEVLLVASDCWGFDLLYRFFDDLDMPYNIYSVIYNTLYVINASIGLIVSYVLYLLFTRKQRKEFSAWLFLLVPGAGIFRMIGERFVYAIANIVSLNNNLYGAIMILITIVLCVLQAVIAYFAARGIFLKILKQKEQEVEELLTE